VADLLPCPFCGETPDASGNYTFVETDGPKWGAVRCCGTGPEVRTGYGPVDEWRDDAIAAWNERKAPPSTEAARALLAAAEAFLAERTTSDRECDAFDVSTPTDVLMRHAEKRADVEAAAERALRAAVANMKGTMR
jgi:hypothetical protein